MSKYRVTVSRRCCLTLLVVKLLRNFRQILQQHFHLLIFGVIVILTPDFMVLRATSLRLQPCIKSWQSHVATWVVDLCCLSSVKWWTHVEATRVELIASESLITLNAFEVQSACHQLPVQD